MPTIPSIGARAFGAQLEHSVVGSFSQASIAVMLASSRCAITVGSGVIVRVGAIVIGSTAAGSTVRRFDGSTGDLVCPTAVELSSCRADRFRRNCPTTRLTACAMRPASALRLLTRSGLSWRSRHRDSGD
ncbi:MAG: hypothetical protein HYW10_02775 [Candidatus Omnitrophica bacterium]|nr:hypothetical protein [Candidatus Omnitrophota bacterium]